ncbi:MAG: efflux RND transporter periplasmic adaptor subunit [Alphaproteobacteria bacterium]|nr:efflux RND transporter periplasmic adaptor subunit [Alphaproteobacteria bacterium]
MDWRSLLVSRKRKLVAAAGGVAAVAIVTVLTLSRGEGASEYRLAAIDRGDIVRAILTSGTTGAVVTVDVSSQISGLVSELLADFNTVVRKGDLLARIDPQTFESKVRQARAELAVARANVSMQRAAFLRAQADHASATANLENAAAKRADSERELKRKEELVLRGVASNRDVEKSRLDMETATAQVHATTGAIAAAVAQQTVAQAQIENALAQVQKSDASLEQALIDLDRTRILAPVDGIVVNRVVNIGQTVAASLNAPVLFTIAQDLRQMQVETRVDEADIGQVRVGLPVTFTVDAHVGRAFQGRVEQVRQAPQNVQNVVTYTVVVSADNADQRLLPGMTANVQIILDRRSDVLRVPAQALRFRPGEAPPAASGAQAAAGGPFGGGPPPGGGGRAAGAGGPAGGAQVAAQTNPAELLNRLTSQLQLSPAQRQQAEGFSNEMRESLQRLRGQQLSREETAAELRKAREQFNDRLRGILTAEQRTKFAALLAQAQSQAQTRGGPANTAGRVWILDKNGKPEPVDVRLGLTNGSVIELVSGDVAAGQQIVVGVNQTGRPNAGLTGIRF